MRSLWHLVLIMWQSSTAIEYPTFSRVDIAITYTSIVAGSFLLSLCSYLLVEKPAANVEGALLARALGTGRARGGRGGAPKHAASGVANPQLGEPLIDPVADATPPRSAMDDPFHITVVSPGNPFAAPAAAPDGAERAAAVVSFA